jgi:AcrR family transcriptional regulator
MPRHRFADTRDRIESAAIHLFVEKSVGGTTVRDIAGRVDLSEGALYRHFASKDDLVWQVFEKHYVALADDIRRLAAEARTTRGKIAAIIRGCCRAHDADPTLFRFLLFTQHGQLAKLAPGTPTPVDAVRDVIVAGIRAGDLPDQDADLATALVLGVVLQPVTFSAYGRLPTTLGPIAERLVAAAWNVVATV